MTSDTGQQSVRDKADFITGLVFVVLGAVVFYLSYTMPRLEARNIHPTTIPGLVPMALGAGLFILGGLLALKARKGIAGEWDRFFAVFRTLEVARSMAALGLVLVFTLVLVGSMPFWAASMIFLFAFVVMMEGVLTPTRASWTSILLWAALTAALAGSAIYYLFAELFLVRLP